MQKTMKAKLVSLLVAASFAAPGALALAAGDDIQADLDGNDISVVARGHGFTISELAQATPGGPEKGAIISAAAKLHGTAVSEAAKAKDKDASGGDNDTSAEAKDKDASGGKAEAGKSKAAAARR